MKKRTLLVALCYLILGTLAGLRANAQATTRIQFEKYNLPNGLEVILHDESGQTSARS